MVLASKNSNKLIKSKLIEFLLITLRFILIYINVYIWLFQINNKLFHAWSDTIAAFVENLMYICFNSFPRGILSSEMLIIV